MNTEKIVKHIESLFITTDNENFRTESGITFDSRSDIKRIGYCTNLTIDSIEKAKDQKIDLLITHHDAWEFLYGLKDECISKLRKYNISHYYTHLPLDDCDFGTNDTLAELLELKIVERTHLEDGFLCGRITELDKEISFIELVERVEKILGEPVQAWQFNDKKISKIGLVCGGGGLSPHVNIAVEKNCDTYITAEKSLYTIEFAQFKHLNLIIGSHTYTEIFGVESLAKKVKNKYSNLEIIRIDELHLETDNRLFNNTIKEEGKDGKINTI